jgi:hypothetical protein
MWWIDGVVYFVIVIELWDCEWVSIFWLELRDVVVGRDLWILN